jgi:hypothetical protein
MTKDTPIMAKQFREDGLGVHLMYGEFSACGDAFDQCETEGNEGARGPMLPTNKRVVTCPDCIRFIDNCRNVRTERKPKEPHHG